MASTDSRPIPIKNTAYRVYFPVWKKDGTLITTWTGLTTAAELCKDAAGFVAATNDPVELGSSGCGYLDIDAGEMNYDCVTVKVLPSNTDAVPTIITLYPEETGDINVDVSAWKGEVVPTPAATGVPDVNVTHLVDSATSAANLEKSASTMVIGTAKSGGTQTTVSVQSTTAAIIAINDGRPVGRNLIVSTEAEKFTACRIIGFTTSAGTTTITLHADTPLTAALDPADEFVIV